MSEPILLAGHRYIVGRKEYAVVRMATGEKKLGKIIGWADAIGRPCKPSQAEYVVTEYGPTSDRRTMLVGVPR